MSLEYEVKIKVENLEEIERRLLELGAVLVDEVEEEDHYIDLRPCIDLRARDEALRVRISRSRIAKRELSELTYKGPRIVPNTKIRKEISVSVEDGRRLIEVFRSLGFRDHVVKKKRKIYRYGPYIFFLDNVENLGTFVEIEIEGVESVEQFLQELRKVISLLRISEKFIDKSYIELLMEKLEEIGEKANRDKKCS